ncbi:MAG: 5'/3'-nucleotidase SurE [Deltaproteobacteria bacterium RIFCSPLOWO2_12_FULL_44_12]|nr:MAG: 5'/3'-nucleotidase SurE [Deltaproteobacteria bacterium RIFCSPHIGHO2_01_FULL_43_49]OGQ15386.1 MAG: 5'/3'-nucleotidase SurE [Deltaproteobacteria bacterium RIFCSPHIGHO2_02_FULL_44_53]OGQ29580.1 MAG: 5'/3'-nucleotidase SurE [Deltaproteobacteria bacterium RIFCSPHIGHO2_12_FULL_44_21]OGQ32193.1 MAG: 5'/3'-nucleotidase SurE [Deltaproteobacteria bacterium RIFCSPLOWO2_01_FULL_45_74]OGQ43834.1 MAG: 5'/3'-nucleotidase SurE [Deltaproteobacteria bacterium RIFCSPLOWO2_02_FULL_44_34]OGQ70891.1 MAG: 5'
MSPKAKKKIPLILVSNDDGFYSEGIKVLAAHLKGLGKVITVAPDQERSAASHSLTLHRPLRVKKLKEDVYAVDGTPTDCITLGVKEILPRTPDLIVSGINKGANLGDDVHYSGTVSAAVEGGIMGIPSIAISLMSREGGHFETAAHFAVKLAKKVLEEGLPSGVILNVNVPDIPLKQVKGYQFTKQGKRNYGDIIADRIDPRGRKYYWIGGDEHGFEDILNSDCNAVLSHHISVTPIRVNLTDHEYLETIRQWKL